MTSAATQLRGACSAKWAETAVSNELTEIANLPQQNINKPASPFFVSLLKIASVVKAGYMPQYEAITSVKRTCAPLTWIPQKEIDYQWKRAYDKAKPRHPKEQTSLPGAERERQEFIGEILYTYDLDNERLTFLRHVPSNVVQRADELAKKLSNWLEYGEIPEIKNTTFRRTDTDPHGVTVSLYFKSYSQSLADCVFIACSRLQGFIWNDWGTGSFSIWLRTASL